jgi:hypothetical protein
MFLVGRVVGLLGFCVRDVGHVDLRYLSECRKRFLGYEDPLPDEEELFPPTLDLTLLAILLTGTSIP